VTTTEQATQDLLGFIDEIGDQYATLTPTHAAEVLVENWINRFDAMEDKRPEFSAAQDLTKQGQALVTAVTLAQIPTTDRLARVARILGFALQNLSGNAVEDIDTTGNKLLTVHELITQLRRGLANL
jgi:hypothetical protein